MRKLVYLLILVICLTSVSAISWSGGEIINITIINNTFLGGNTSFNQSLTDSLYVNLDGDNMTGDLSTTGFFNGLFNWTITTASNLWLSFTGSELSFNETHLNATGDARWVNVNGDTMTGPLEITTNLTVANRIFLKNTNHTFKIGMDSPFNGLGTDTFWFNDEDKSPEGHLVFAFTQQNRTILAGQFGRNNSAGILGNSWMVIPNNLSTNYSFYTNCIEVIDSLGEVVRIECDTSGTGADLFVQDDIQIGGTLFAGEGIRAESIAQFVMNGNDFNIFGGVLHLQEPVNFTTGFEVGDPIINFQAFFEGSISPFANQQSDLGNWFSTTSSLCDDGACAEANGAGSGNVIMQTNFSTVNTNNTELSFVYSLVGIVGSDSFSVVMNNNVGSGDVTIFTDSGTDVLVQQNIALPVSMENQSIVSLEFICDATIQITRQCFVDTVKVNGTANLTTTANQTGFDGQICFGDGAKDAQGICLFGIYFNASIPEIQFRGNVTSITVEDETIINDLTVGGDITVGGNVSANYLFGNLPWINLTDYPVACPPGSAITELGDSVTCTVVGNLSWNESHANTLYVNIDGDTMTGNLSILENLTVGGRVGIGTSSPGSTLEVNGEINNAQLGSIASDNYYFGDENTLKRDSTGTGNIMIGGAVGRKITNGIANVGIGNNAFFELTDGSGNFAMGSSALGLLSSGDGNVAIGNGALKVLTTQGSNVGLGNQAMEDGTSRENIAIGSNVMRFNTGTLSWRNVFIGVSAGQGSDGVSAYEHNVGIGYQSGMALTSGGFNIFLGSESGKRQTTNSNLLIIDNQDRGSAAAEANSSLIYGLFNSDPSSQELHFNTGLVNATGDLFVGDDLFVTDRVGIGTASPTQKLDVNGSINIPITSDSSTGIIFQNGISLMHTYGTTNVFFGVSAGNFVSTGIGRNIGIGTNAINSLTTGSENVGIGTNALTEITTGRFNLGIGEDAGKRITLGTNNLFMGRSAGSGITTTGSNVGIGASALTGAGVASSVAIGGAAGRDGTGGLNVFIGASAGQSTGGGAQIVMIGQKAGEKLTGSANVLIGYLSGQGATGSEGASNTFFGFQTGRNIIDGDNNILIGYLAGDSLNNGSRNILIGNDVDLPTPNTDDYLSIGDIIFGDISTGFVNITGDLVIGDDLFIIDSVGIGTITPGYKLEIDGDFLIDTDTGNQPLWISRVGAENQAGKFWVDDNSLYIQSIQDEASGMFGNIVEILDADADSVWGIQISTGINGQAPTAYKAWITKTGSAYFADSVGIGTQNPTHQLNVLGNANITTDLLIGGNTILTGNINIIGNGEIIIGEESAGDEYFGNYFELQGVSGANVFYEVHFGSSAGSCTEFCTDIATSCDSASYVNPDMEVVLSATCSVDNVYPKYCNCDNS